MTYSTKIMAASSGVSYAKMKNKAGTSHTHTHATVVLLHGLLMPFVYTLISHRSDCGCYGCRCAIGDE